MGAWSTGSFDNDDAMDFVARLESDGADAIQAALAEVTGLDAQHYLEAPEASCAIAAAEIVAAARDGDVSRLPDDAREWLDDCRDSIVAPSLLASAHRAVERVLSHSELKELWEEGGANANTKAWEDGVRALIKRLKVTVASVPGSKAVRKPRARKVAFESGAVLRVDLDGAYHTYARMLARFPMIVFYDLRVATAVEDARAIVARPVLFVLAVNGRAYDKGRWPRIGHVPLDLVSCPIPPQFMQDIGTDKCEIVDETFNSRPATPEECVGLERVAVWGPEHVEERIRDHYADRPNAHLAYMKVRLGKAG